MRQKYSPIEMNVMKKSSKRTLQIVCVLALICIVLWVAFYAFQSYFVLTTGSGHGVINWGSPNMGGKLTMFVINRLLIIALAGLMAAFVFNILKHLKGGTIFNRANVVLLWIMAVVLPIHSFISDNMGFACSATDQHEWVRRMNSIRNRAEEIVKSEVLYT